MVSGAQLHLVINSPPEVELSSTSILLFMKKASTLCQGLSGLQLPAIIFLEYTKDSGSYVTLFTGQTTPSISIPFIKPDPTDKTGLTSGTFVQ